MAKITYCTQCLLCQERKEGVYCLGFQRIIGRAMKEVEGSFCNTQHADKPAEKGKRKQAEPEQLSLYDL